MFITMHFLALQLLLIFLILLQCLPSSQNGAKTHFHSLMWREDSITSRRNSLLCLTVFGRESQSVIWGWVTQDHRWPCASNQQTLEPAGGDFAGQSRSHTQKTPELWDVSIRGPSQDLQVEDAQFIRRGLFKFALWVRARYLPWVHHVPASRDALVMTPRPCEINTWLSQVWHDVDVCPIFYERGSCCGVS